MKELSIEQKAQRYDEALERAKEKYAKFEGMKQGDVLEDVFPELKESKESEDEKICKWLIALIKSNEYGSISNVGKMPCPKLKVLAWLEKQGEKKPTNKVKPKFKVGDVMRTLQEASDGIKDGLPVVVSIDEEYYHCNNELIAIKDQDDYEYPPMNRRQKRAWSEEDEELLKVAMESCEQCGNEYAYYWLKSLKDRYTWRPSDE